MANSRFQLDAALWVARAIDSSGSDAVALDRTLRAATTQGRFPKVDLDLATETLANASLLAKSDGRVVPHPSLVSLAALPDAAALPMLDKLLTWSAEEVDVNRRAVTGEKGELAVVRWCVAELTDLGRLDLAGEVVRVSIISDRFGYDVTAPTLGGDARLLEIKATAASAGKTFRFVLSRNEYEVGRRAPGQWAMVACVMEGDDTAVLGWCRAAELERYLPDDGNGRWTEAQVALPTSALLAGAPSAVL